MKLSTARGAARHDPMHGPGGVRVVKRPPGGSFATTQLIAPAGDLPQLVTRRGHAAVVFATESRLGEARLRISVRD